MDLHEIIELPNPSTNNQDGTSHMEMNMSGHIHHRGMPEPLPSSSPPTKKDWDAFRLIFTQLYSIENKTLAEVMDIMEREYKFVAT